MKAKVTNEVIKQSSNFSVQDIIGWLRNLLLSDKFRHSALKNYALERAIVAIARIGSFRDVVINGDNITCATCGADLKKELKTEYHIKHCPYCGQRVRWGTKKEEKTGYINQEEAKDEEKNS